MKINRETIKTIALVAILFALFIVPAFAGSSNISEFDADNQTWNEYVDNGIKLLFYVDSPDMVHLYRIIFDAVGRIFHSNSYVEMLKLVFFLGGFVAFVSGLFKSISGGGSGDGAISGYFKYIAIALSLLVLAFTHWNTEILIKSKTFDNTCTGIDMGTTTSDQYQIPSLIALGYYSIHKFGETMTDLAEDAFTTPTSGGWYKFQGMTNNGGYVGAIRDSLRILTIDPNKVSLAKYYDDAGTKTDFSRDANWTNYDMGKITKALFTDCILVPFSAKGIDGESQINDLKGSANIWQWLKDLYADNPSVGGIKARDYMLTYMGEEYKCGDFFDTMVVPAIDYFGNDVGCGYQVSQGAVALITGATGTITSEYSQVATQAGLVASLEDSLSDLGVGVSGVSYASGKTRAEFAMTNLASGQYMAEMLPILQMTIRAVLYAFFPFIFVVIMFPGGIKTLTNYLGSLLWVELWSPVAAILDMIISIYAGNKYQTMYNTTGLTTQNITDFLTTGSTIAGVAGYLYLMVPALTWLIMKGSAHMLSGIGGAMAAGMAHNIRSETINRDMGEVAKAQEASITSGKHLSMAEAQHYEAVQQGRIAGTKLGLDMKAGMDTVIDLNQANHQKEISGYLTAKKLTGLGGATLGQHLGREAGRGMAIKALTAANVLDSTLKGSAEGEGAFGAGKIQAQNEHRRTKNMGHGVEKLNITKDEGTSKHAHRHSYGDLSRAHQFGLEHNYGRNIALGSPEAAESLGRTQTGIAFWQAAVTSETIRHLQETYGPGAAQKLGGANATQNMIQIEKSDAIKQISKDMGVSEKEAAAMVASGQVRTSHADGNGNIVAQTYSYDPKTGKVVVSQTRYSPENIHVAEKQLDGVVQQKLLNNDKERELYAKNKNISEDVIKAAAGAAKFRSKAAGGILHSNAALGSSMIGYLGAKAGVDLTTMTTQQVVDFVNSRSKSELDDAAAKVGGAAVGQTQYETSEMNPAMANRINSDVSPSNPTPAHQTKKTEK